MDSFDLAEQRIAQLEQIPEDIRHQIERGDGAEYALDLSLNRLRGIEQIGVFEHVLQLDLSGNQLESVNGIQALRRLQSLDLSRNCIASVDLLALLPALQILKVAENSLATVDSLQLLPELRVVDASYNRITKWPPLAGLSLLETLDLSDNMLGAFSSSQSATLFPSRLRRLSIARNQIDKLCGVACLGLQLPTLEFLAFDGNPIVLEVTRSGGQLERLLATFFPSLPLSNDGGLTMSGRRHEDFTASSHTVNTLKRAILEGREDTLDEFLVTGSAVFPPPAPIELQDQSAADNSLSHGSKMEIWKRIQEDRKTQGNSFTPDSSEVKREKSVRWGEHSVLSAPLDDVRQPALTAADLAVSEASPALDVSSMSVMNPLDSTFSTSKGPIQSHLPPNGDVLVKKLTEQVATMRKYMKVWIKREKMVRDASARKIQRWFRGVKRKITLRQRILQSRTRRQEEHSFRHCSSTQMQHVNARSEAASAQTIQKLARGFLICRRFVLFRRKHVAACRIQRIWRKTLQNREEILQCGRKLGKTSRHTRWHGVLRGMIRCSRDVKQLQQVCAVQKDAIGFLWDKPKGEDMYPASVVDEMKSEMTRQSLEIDQLKQQLQALQSLITGKIGGNS
ncbi:hypothetical protein V7S43_017464 [Phytophthora oleae]|uniref:Uncharacterized protein n=1 Tax=Phytophthora oleae TaxID=2107226 RepID=A0ABD3ET49_9STRA